MPAPDFSLYLITDRRQVPGGDLATAVGRALAGGVRAVQLREKDLPPAPFRELARLLRALTREFGARLLINGRPEVALAVGADGVHLGGGALSVTDARRLLGPQPLIGLSTHHLDEIAPAAAAGADFVTFSPVYFTPSKASFGPPQGLERLRAACAASPLPVYALGGIGPQQIPSVLSCGARGVALISAVLGAVDPAAAAREILTRLG